MKRQAKILLGLTAGLIVAGIGLGTTSGQSSKPPVTILLTGIEFKPNRIQVSVGDTVKFINRDKFKHDVYLVRTANQNDVLSGPTTMSPGQSVTVTIAEEGLYTLYCTIHGGMTGKITTTGSFELTDEEKKRAAAKKVFPPSVKKGEDLFWGQAQCHQCHAVGDRGDGVRGPNLQDIGFRARLRAQKLNLPSATAYMVQSVLEPPAYLVEGYTNDMAIVYQPPIDLNKKQLEEIVSYLQSQGGEVDTWGIEINEAKLNTEPILNPFQSGDPVKGQKVFKELGCGSCHTVGDRKAVSLGPDLTEIGAYRNWTWLAKSVLQPNDEVGQNWRSVTMDLKSGESVSGMLRKRTDEEVVLLVTPDKTQSFAGSEIENLEISELSKMPADYAQLMTFEETANLISYLQSLRGPGEKANQKNQ